MTIALWAILAACLLPILCAWLGKVGAKGFDNSAPREWIEKQSGWRQRVDWAQRNHYEVFPAFAAAVIVAHLAHAPQGWADALAVAFVVLRLAYIAAYAFNRASLRSALWSLGLLCVLGLFAISA
jgi:uncharacterized MAPEG superfamily protein